MHTKKAMGALMLTLVLSLGCSARAPAEAERASVDRADVERIITTLAADDMAGRAAFSPGIESARAFIETEFERAGLETLDGLDSYSQAFPIYTVTVTESRVRLNGQDVAPDRYAVSATEASFRWTTTHGVEVVTVGPSDDLGAAFTSVRRGGRNVLGVVDPSHSEMFGRLRGFLSRPANVLEMASGNAVLVLGDGHAVTDIEIEATATVGEQELANVVGVIPGRRAAEIVLFAAHYDHIGIRPPVEGDSIANGANDNASGTTAVLALARYFMRSGQPERTLVFATFTAEERGGFGSRYLSRQLDPGQVVAMFNIEMIGKPAVSGPNTAWITGFDMSDFGTILQEAVAGTVYSFYPDPYPDQNLFYRSDNATLARLGVPAHSISTTPIDVDPDYHRVSDEVSTLDLDHMTNTIRALAQGAATIVSGEATPTRVDPSRVN